MTLRALAGMLGFAAILLVFGWILLWAAGIARSRRDGLRAAGLALFLAWATTGLVVTFELVLGLRTTVVEIVAGQAIVALGALVVSRRIAPMEHPRSRFGRSWLGTGSAAVLSLYVLGLLGPAIFPQGIANSESWSQWLVKAKVIYHFGLDTGVGGYTSQQNGSYPPLDPGLESATWHFAGKPDFLLLPFMHWIVFASFLGGVAFLLAPRVRPALLWPPLALLVLTPNLPTVVGSSLGEEMVAMFVGMAALFATMWLLDDEPRWLALGSVFFAAATLTKSEGLVMSLIFTILVAVAARRLRALVLVAAPIVVEIPWKIWQKTNHVPPTFSYDWNRLLHPDQLWARTDYITYGARSLLGQTFAPSHWLIVLPVVLALGALAVARRNALAFVAIGFPLLTFLAFELTYWVGADVCTWEPGTPCTHTWRDIEWLVGLSANRLPIYFVVVAALLLPLLLRELADRSQAT